jgi:iron complex transport system substrate-binding protein
MNRTNLIVIVVIAVLGISVVAYAANTFVTTSEPEEETGSYYVIDTKGNNVTINLPVEKVVSLNSGLTELICALGNQDKLVGRNSGSTFPYSVLDIPVAGESSASPNVEVILEMEPDVLFADTMLSRKTELLNQIKSAGIAVIIEQPGNVTRLPTIVDYMGTILGKEDKAEEILEFIHHYEDLVNERIENIAEEDKSRVFVEWSKQWKTFSGLSVRYQILVNAGGVSIAQGYNETISSPVLSPEYVAEQNPDVILRMITSEEHDIADFQDMYTDMTSRTALELTTAISDGRVHVYDSTLCTGLRYPVGLLYWAKWFNPEQFQEIDPAAVHQELVQKFFELDLEGVYTYP